jgi:hypothetical protein
LLVALERLRGDDREQARQRDGARGDAGDRRPGPAQRSVSRAPPVVSLDIHADQAARGP